MRTSPIHVTYEDVRIADLAPSLAGLRIAHVSDFHFVRWTRLYEEARRTLMGLEYDLLAVTGDIGHRPDRWREAAALARTFFAPIAGRAPTFGVLGNHDHVALAQEADLPIRFLANESIEQTCRGERIRIAGVQQAGHSVGDVDAALAGAGDRVPTVLLAHYPSVVYRVEPGRVALQLSGHTHGGQIRFPFIGCVFNHDRIPLSASRGLHEINGTLVHVTAGVGVSSPIRLRINCPPEVSLLTLRPTTAPAAKKGQTRRQEAPAEVY